MNATDPFAKHPQSIAALPRIVRLYIFHSIVGFALAGIVTGLILYYDFAGIGRLVATVEGGWLAALIFFILNGTVLSGVQTAIVVMSMDYDDDTPRGPRPPMEQALIPIPVDQRALEQRAMDRRLGRR